MSRPPSAPSTACSVELGFLSHWVSAEGMAVDQSKVSAVPVQYWAVPPYYVELSTGQQC